MSGVAGVCLCLCVCVRAHHMHTPPDRVGASLG